MQVATYVLFAVLPAAVFHGAWVALQRWSSGSSWRVQPSAPSERALEVLVSDLRRLEADFSRTLTAEVPYRAARLKAISLAYDDTLRICCRVLDVPEPGRPPWSPTTRLAIEAELARAGLDW